MQVKIRFKISEPNWVLEFEVVNLSNISFTFDKDVPIKIVDDVVKFFVDDFFHVDLHFRLEVVKSVEKASNVPLQRPTDVSFPEPLQ